MGKTRESCFNVQFRIRSNNVLLHSINAQSVTTVKAQSKPAYRTAYRLLYSLLWYLDNSVTHCYIVITTTTTTTTTTITPPHISSYII